MCNRKMKSWDIPRVVQKICETRFSSKKPSSGFPLYQYLSMCPLFLCFNIVSTNFPAVNILSRL